MYSDCQCITGSIEVCTVTVVGIQSLQSVKRHVQ